MYSLVVLAPPTSGQTASRAAEFARSVLRRGHSICRIFFFDAGTACGAMCSTYPQDEHNPRDSWVRLAEEHQIELVLCISSALRNGVLDHNEAERYGQPTGTMHPAFVLGGLGLLVEACDLSDRVVTFAG